MKRSSIPEIVCAIVLLLVSAAGQAQAQCTTAGQADDQADNTAVPETCTVVVSSKFDLVNSGSFKNFQVQDDTGGITVFGSNALIDSILATINEGDRIRLSGTTDFFNGLFELVDGTPQALMVTSNGGPGPIPTPDVITMADLADTSTTAEFLESRLVRVNCALFTTTGAFTGQTNYSVIDSTGTGIVRVTGTCTTIIGDAIPSTPVDLVGIFSQFDDANPGLGYQILLRTGAGIIANNVCSTPEAPPTAAGRTVIGYQDTNQNITLQGSPGNLPGATLRFRIKSLPTLGALFDGATPITTTPFTLSASTVTYDPNAAGLDGFNFDVWNGLAGANQRFSAEATMRVGVQKVNADGTGGSVFITEFMANPTGASDFDATNPQEEWIEIYNDSGLAVTLGHIGDATTPDFPVNTNGNLEQEGTVIPANSAMVIAHSHSTTSPASNDAFLCCWGLTGSASQVQFVRDRANTGIPPADWKGLSNAGDTIYLYDINGGLLDAVAYQNNVPPWQPDNGFGSSALTDAGSGLNGAMNDDGGNWFYHDPECGLEGFVLFGMYDSCASGLTGDLDGCEVPDEPVHHDRGSPLYIEGLTMPTTPQVPPTALAGAAYVASPATSVNVTLTSQNNDGTPGTFSYVIESLPTVFGATLSDPGPGGDPITTVPYTLSNNGNVVVYTSPADAAGTDTFQFSALEDGVQSCQPATITVGIYTFAAGPPLCLIISEVVDGGRTGGTPKWVEITNTGSAAYTFPEGGLIIQSNAATDTTVDVDLTGVILPVGEKFVIASSLQGGAAVFLDTYGFDADLYSTAAFGNGNDRYMITNRADGSNIIDIYGEFGLDGTGRPWDYIDGYARRKPAFTSGAGAAFDNTQWLPDPAPTRADTLEAGTNDASAKALLQANTFPNAHDHAGGCVNQGGCCNTNLTGCPFPNHDNTSCCRYTTSAACTGTYQGDGELCDPNPCGPIGACCTDNFGCTPDLTYDECVAIGGLDWNQGQDCTSCPQPPPAATVNSAVSRRNNPRVGLPNGACDTNLLPPRKSEMHQGGVQQVRIGFDVPPGSGSGNQSSGDISLFSATCAGGGVFAADAAPFTWDSTSGTLIVTFAPGLTNARTYRLDIGGVITSIPGEVFVRGLIADADGNGLVNAVDRSTVVGAWTGPGGFSCATDMDNNGTTNAVDRSIVVGQWTNAAQNCAP